MTALQQVKILLANMSFREKAELGNRIRGLWFPRDRTYFRCVRRQCLYCTHQNTSMVFGGALMERKSICP